ncbi:MAG: glycosyltransferase family 39 protein [Planctomycetaceae bacterium]|nr:glycosyltransferase family 39 protein [Planctomycetaceae bacterium]
MWRTAVHPNAVTRPTAMLSGGADSYRLGWFATCGLWLFGLTMLLPYLGTSRALTYHEIVFAEPAREMLAHGEFIVPRIAGVPFTDKPPLMAWLIATSMAVFQSEAEWVVRLPSVLAAIGTAWVIAVVAARWFGAQVGALSGFIHLTTVHVMMQARLAECDTLLGLAVAGALGLFGLAMVEGPLGKLTGRWVPWAFYACAAAAFMTKFLAGPLFVVAGVGAFTLIERRWGEVLRWLANPVGIVIALGLTVPWCIAAYLEHPGLLDNVLYHNVGRFSGTLGQNEPPWAYAYLVPFMMLPWSPLLIVGLVQAIRHGLHHDARWRLLAAWSLGGIGVLSLAAFKTKHYAIPALAPLAVISARALVDHLQWRKRATQHWTLLSIAAIVAGVTAAWIVIGKLPRISSDERNMIGVALAFVAVGMTVVLWYERQRHIRGQCIASFATAWCVSLVVQIGIIPFHDSYRHQTEFAAVLNEQWGERAARMTLYLVGLPENQVTYYLRPRLEGENDPLVFLRQVARRPHEQPLDVLGPRWVFELLDQYGEVTQPQHCPQMNRYQTEVDRLTLFRWQPDGAKLAQLPDRLVVPQRR